MESFLFKGFLVGLIFGVPAGAIGALTIQRSLTYGFLAGLLTGLGSSAADVLYACVGVLGISAVSDFLLAWQTPISLAGGALIIIMGIGIFKGKPAAVSGTEGKTSLPVCFASSFAIAIANPATILSFVVAFASFGIGDVDTLVQGIQVITGILLGTVFGWCVLSGAASRLRERITDQLYRNLNRILGVLLMLFGICIALSTGGNK